MARNNLIELFCDSDVVVSSFLSSKGAAALLLDLDILKRLISNIGRQEIQSVVERLEQDKLAMNRHLKSYFQEIKLSYQKVKEFQGYVLDPNDAHIVAGAKLAEACYLVTYNLKDFKKDLIRSELDIITMSPAQFLQYLRAVRKIS